MKLTVFSLIMLMSNPSFVKAGESISINKVGAFKFTVSASIKDAANVIITDADNNVIHQEYVTNSKLFNFDQLSDGEYKMTVLDGYKKIVETKSFKINTQIKKDLVIVQ